METLNTEGFLFTQTSVKLSLLAADFGDGYQSAALVGDPKGLRTWAIKIDVLPDTEAAPFIDGQSRANYLWEFWLSSKAAANECFWVLDPKDESLYLAEFADDQLTFEILCAKIYGTGLELRQRRLLGVPSPIEPLTEAPSDLTARAISETEVSLDLDPKSGATYSIERKTGAGGSYAIVGSTTSFPYSDSGLTALTTYYYRVKASNQFGETGYSNEVSITTATNPSLIANLKLWVKADSLALAEAAGVSSWPDESTNAATPAQATAGLQPKFYKEIQGGKPGILFDGVDDELLTAKTINNILTQAAYTVFVLARPLAIAGTGATAYSGDALIQEDGPGVAMGITLRQSSGRNLIQAGSYSGLDRFTEQQISLNQTYLFKQRHGGGNTYLQVDDRPETSFGFGDSTFDTSKKLSIGGGYTRPINGYEFEILAYDRALNTTEEQGLREYFYKRWFLLNTPQAYQVFQRSTPTTGTIKIAGWSNITGAIEASFNGGPYKTIVNNTLPGPFSGTLTEQAIGVGDLTVRSKAAPTITSVVHNVGIGDVFIAAGQSNPSGRGANKQTFTASGGLIGSMFCNDYVWQPLRDFVDSNFNQVDAVSNENISGLQDNYGSMWPLVGTHYLSAKGVCFAVIPCALGSTSITQHLPGSNHQDRSTLYGSLVYRALQAGGVKAVIWWQGETDMAAGMAQANYSAHLHTLADALFADLGVPLIPCKLQHIDSRATEAQQNAINNAITGAWGTGHILTGPNLNSLDCLNAAVSSDGVHITTNAGLTSAANLWSAILETL